MTWREKKAALEQFELQHRSCNGSQFTSIDGGNVTAQCEVCGATISQTFAITDAPLRVVPSMGRSDAVVLVIGAATEDEARCAAQSIPPPICGAGG